MINSIRNQFNNVQVLSVSLATPLFQEKIDEHRRGV